jgi:hypothetical protein
MANPAAAAPTRLEQPLILIRGFGGLGVEDEKRIAYQGFNDGTVYPQKRGENYIYEGLILRFMKSRWTYRDATNVVGYYGSNVEIAPSQLPAELAKLNLDASFFSGGKVVIDPGMALELIRSSSDQNALKTLWVFRYYDLNDREFPVYGKALVQLIQFIRALSPKDKTSGLPPKVNIIAHSMGGLIVREAVQSTFPALGLEAREHINKVVTLGTPHQGISFQILHQWIGIGASDDLNHFNPDRQKDAANPTSFVNFSRHFPSERVLTVVGTNYKTYGPMVASWLNRAFSVEGEFGLNYNRSDGLVKQTNAQLPGAPRTFVHKCHGGPDSLVTSREAFEVATRFLFGNIKLTLRLVGAKVKRGFDLIGKSEFFFGVAIKPRGVDFELFNQSAEAENCYGPFHTADFSDPDPAFGWAGDGRLIWEGWLDTTARFAGPAPSAVAANDIVMRLDIYVGERDLFGLGFSDNIVFRRQYYVRALFDDLASLKLRGLELHTGEEFREDKPGQPLTKVASGWQLSIGDSSFEATLEIGFSLVPPVG